MCTCEDFSVRWWRRDPRFVTAVRASRVWEIVSSLHRHTHRVFCVRIESSWRSCSASRSCYTRSCSARSCSARGCSPHSLHTYWELKPCNWSFRSGTDDHDKCIIMNTLAKVGPQGMTCGRPSIVSIYFLPAANTAWRCAGAHIQTWFCYVPEGPFVFTLFILKSPIYVGPDH